jgi:hypothetical protein
MAPGLLDLRHWVADVKEKRILCPDAHMLERLTFEHDGREIRKRGTS